MRGEGREAGGLGVWGSNGGVGTGILLSLGDVR